MQTVLKLCVVAATGSSSSSAGVDSTSSSALVATTTTSGPLAPPAPHTTRLAGKDARRTLADRVAALLCLYITRHSGEVTVRETDDSHADSDGSSSSGDVVKGSGGRGDCQEGAAAGEGKKKRGHAARQALDSSFLFLLSMLARGAGQHPILRDWLWSGAGAIPFSPPSVKDESGEGRGECQVAQATGSGPPYVAGAPFAFHQPKAAASPQPGEAGGTEEDGGPSASEFLIRWALTALHQQERCCLRSLPRRALWAGLEEGRVRGVEEAAECDGVVLPSTTTALRIAPPAAKGSSLARLNGGARDGGGDGGGEGENGGSAYALASALLSPSSHHPKPIALTELPPLVVAYVLLESEAQRRAHFLLPTLRPETGAARAVSPGSHSSSPVLEASLPSSSGIHFILDRRDAVFALPAGFERRLHDCFTRLLAFPTLPSAASSSAPDLNRWYRQVRGADIYEGAMTAAAAMFASELQATAAAPLRGVADEADEGEGRGTQGPSCPLAHMLASLESFPTAALEYQHTSSSNDAPPARLVWGGRAWSALLTSLALSDGAPGQYIRSVLLGWCDEGGGTAGVGEGGAGYPTLSSLLHYDHRGGGGSGDDAERDGARGTLEETGDGAGRGFVPGLFLPTMEELTDYGSGGNGDDRLAQLFHPSAEPLKQDKSAGGRPVPGLASHSAATLVAVALRHPRSVLHQLEQLFHLLATCRQTNPMKEGARGKEGSRARKRRREERGAAVEELAEAEEELARRLTNLACVYMYSCPAGLPLAPLVGPQLSSCAEAGKPTSVKGEQEGKDEKPLPPPSSSLVGEATATHGAAMVKEEEVEVAHTATPPSLPPPPSTLPKLRLKLSLHPRKQQPSLATTASWTGKEEEGEGGDSGEDGLSLILGSDGRQAKSSNTVSLQKEARKEEEAYASKQPGRPSPRSPILLTPAEAMQYCWHGEPLDRSPPSSSVRPPIGPGNAQGTGQRDGDGVDSEPPPLADVFAHTLRVFVQELLRSDNTAASVSSSSPVAAPAAVGRRVLPLSVPAHVKAFNACVDAIDARTAHCFCRLAASGQRAASCGHGDGGSAAPCSLEDTSAVGASDVLRGILGGCLTFAVYRVLSRLSNEGDPRLDLPTTLSHVLSVLRPLTRSRRLRGRCGIEEHADGTAPLARSPSLFASVATMSSVLLPRLLHTLVETERDRENKRRQAAAAAEDDRRRRGVLALSGASAQRTTSDADGPCATMLEELRVVLEQLGMVA